MNREDAEEFTQGLGQIVGGSVRVILQAIKLGVPKAIGLKPKDWVNQRLGGYAKLPPADRQKLVQELSGEGETNVTIADALGVDETTIRRDKSSANAETVSQDGTKKQGNTKYPSANAESADKAATKRTAHEDIAKAHFNTPIDGPTSDPFVLGDFRELGTSIPDACVDLIFTDPPYDRESIPLFGDLGRFAARVLKPGASLVTYCGQIQLPEAIALLSEHLRYWWTCSCDHRDGPFTQMREYGLENQWKPILWFVKGTRGDKFTFISDRVSHPREKSHHEWQQSEGDALHFIGGLTAPNSLVVDPFAGGGTTCVAAETLGRRWVGYEIDSQRAARAAERIVALRATAECAA